jgi:tetratricopeptide (TPR) repeat protein
MAHPATGRQPSPRTAVDALMTSTNPSTPPSRRARRWRVPPPLTRGTELLEGSEVLSELTGALAVVVWKSLRNVTLWAETPPQEQAGLFVRGAQEQRLAEILALDADPALREPLETIATLLGNPAAVRREQLSLACRALAQWAERRQAAGTALAFAQAAALVSPGEAVLAYRVGRLARGRGEDARAESWFRRTIMLSRQSGDWHPYALAYLSLGNLSVQRGNLPLARRCHLKAFRAGRRHGYREVQGFALHNLFGVAMETQDSATAQRFALQAFHAYGPSHMRVPALAHDAAILWMREGEFARALPVFRAVLPHLPESDEHTLAVANLARAAGGTGDRALFEGSRERARAALEAREQNRLAAQAFLALARGATSLGLWTHAEDDASRALELATQRGEGQIRFEAESVLDLARSGRVAARPGQETTTAGADPQADGFAEELVRALERDLVPA